MDNAWDSKPPPSSGDVGPDLIFLQVGAALTVWETLESSLAELFDALVSGPSSSRAGFVAFVSVSSSSARTEMLEAAARCRAREHISAGESIIAFVETVRKFGARRNEIAHGRVYNLGQSGCMLGPNNTNSNKWLKDNGRAKYQWSSSEIEYYVEQFYLLNTQCLAHIEAVRAFNGKPNVG